MIYAGVWAAPFWGLCSCCPRWPGGAEPQRLIAPIYNAEDPAHDAYYFSRLLTQVLDKTTDEYGPYTLVPPETFLTDDRLKAAVVQGEVDIMWHTLIGKPEQGLRVIDIPLLGELGHYRALLIRNGEQSRFAQVQTLQDLQSMVAGIGSQWPDASVLAANGLPYTTSTRYSLLFKMLAAGRFDYFPRGLYQIHAEEGLFPELDLVREQSLLLYYPTDIYFLVAEGRQRLAERLELGLARVQADGSQQRLIDSVPGFFWAQQELACRKRHIIPLRLPAPE